MHVFCTTCGCERLARHFCFKCGGLMAMPANRPRASVPQTPWDCLTRSEAEFVKLMMNSMATQGKLPSTRHVTNAMRVSSRRVEPYLGYLHPIRQKFGMLTARDLEDFLWMMRSCQPDA